jgi:hypothetical protein
MNRISFSLLAVMTSISLSQARADAPKKIIVTPSTVFAPIGFDDNDNAQIVFGGYLPNTCYKTAAPLFSVEQGKNKIYITDRAYYQTLGDCLDMEVPYTQVVQIGALTPGKYEIFFENTKGGFYSTGKSIIVKSATRADEDDQMYAPIEQAYIDLQDIDEPKLVLSGKFTNTCMKMKKVEFERMREDILNVFPIATYVHQQQCRSRLVPFHKTIALPRNMYGNSLIHIRSMGGHSFNIVQNFGEEE